jgi:hypothetical protein
LLAVPPPHPQRAPPSRYLRQLPIIVLPSLADDALGEREVDSALADQTWGKTRAWLVTSPDRLPGDDPRDLLRTWYHGNTLLFADRRFNGVQVETFSYNGPYKAGQWRPEQVLNIDFGDQITLVGATVDFFVAERTVRAGDWAPLTLRWRATRPIATDYVVRVRLHDAAGREVAAYDIQPLDGHYPTSRWRPDEQVWDYHDLFIQPDLPPGQYAVMVGLYPVNEPAAALRPVSGAAPGDPASVHAISLTVVR